MSSQQLVYQSLGDQAVKALADYILDEGIAPGGQLPGEEALAALFGVSRPVIREALKTLSGMGVVEIAKGRGSVVLPISSKPLLVYFDRAIRMDRRTIVELVDVRRGIEVEAAGLAAAHRTDQEVERLRAIVEQMRASLTDAEAFVHHDVRFHVQLAEASRNEMLCYLVESIREALRTTAAEGMRGRVTPEQLERVQQIHEQLLHCVAERSIEEARHAMTVHFDEAAIAILTQEEPKGRAGRA